MLSAEVWLDPIITSVLSAVQVPKLGGGQGGGGGDTKRKVQAQILGKDKL